LPGEFIEVGKHGRRLVTKARSDEEDSIVKRLFGGRLRQAGFNARDHVLSLIAEPFFVLNCPLSSCCGSIEDVLEYLTRKEKLSNHKEHVAQRTYFDRIPKVLIIALKRFTFNRASKQTVKMCNTVKYEGTLLLKGGWILGGKSGRPVEFSLTGIIFHHGTSADSGHYTAAVRVGANEWLSYNDLNVVKTDGNRVYSRDDAYVLMYINSTDRLTSIFP